MFANRASWLRLFETYPIVLRMFIRSAATDLNSASVMTAIEGNKMAKRGRAAQALATAAIGSFIAGTIGTLLVAFFTPTIAEQAVKIGAPTYFAIMLLSLVLVTSALGTSKIRGFIGLFMGLTIGLVGNDLSTGQARLTGGQLELADGIDIPEPALGLRPRPLLGLLADRVGFRLALLVIAGPLVVGAFLAGAAAPLPADRAPRPHDLVVEGAR